MRFSTFCYKNDIKLIHCLTKEHVQSHVMTDIRQQRDEQQRLSTIFLGQTHNAVSCLCFIVFINIIITNKLCFN